MTAQIKPAPLSRAAFAPFGDVIMCDGAPHYSINQGTTARYHDLAHIDVSAEGGRPLLSIFRAQPLNPPLYIRVMERHPLGSQAFYPLSPYPYLVVVGAGAASCDVASLQAFLAVPGQGVNYARNVWHHPLIALGDISDFLVVDRGGEGMNVEETRFEAGVAQLVM